MRIFCFTGLFSDMQAAKTGILLIETCSLVCENNFISKGEHCAVLLKSARFADLEVGTAFQRLTH